VRLKQADKFHFVPPDLERSPPELCREFQQ